MHAQPRGLLLAALAMLLAGCAQPTPYQPADDGFGFAEQQLEDDRFRVTFAGNSVTPRAVVQNYLLYRAAEVTLETGHDYFRVVDQDLERSTSYHGFIDDPFHGFHHPIGRHRGFFHPHGFSTVTAHPIDRYTAFADIVVYEGEKPEDDVSAYDARDVIRRLEPSIARAPS